MADGMTAAQAATLYDRDFYDWTRDQAAALRAVAMGHAAVLDWANLAEEIDSLGRRELNDVTSRLSTIVEHLLKLEFSPARDPREGWVGTVGRARDEVADALEASPSLRRKALDAVPLAVQRGGRNAARALRERGESDTALLAHLTAGGYAADQILGDWWPEAPKSKA